MVLVMCEGAARSLQLFPEFSPKVRTHELTPGLARNTEAEPRREPNAKALHHLRCQQLHTSAETPRKMFGGGHQEMFACRALTPGSPQHGARADPHGCTLIPTRFRAPPPAPSTLGSCCCSDVDRGLLEPCRGRKPPGKLPGWAAGAGWLGAGSTWRC